MKLSLLIKKDVKQKFKETKNFTKTVDYIVRKHSLTHSRALDRAIAEVLER